MKRREVGSCHVKGYVGSLQLFHIPDQHTTYLLVSAGLDKCTSYMFCSAQIGIRMAHYWVMLLEHWHVMSPSHVPDDQLAGFEIVHNVAASFMNDTSDTDKYEPQLLAASYETVKLTPYKNYTMALHLRQDELVVCGSSRVGMVCGYLCSLYGFVAISEHLEQKGCSLSDGTWNFVCCHQ